MTPTDICVSLETAKALKEAGWEKETVFGYAPNDAGELVPYVNWRIMTKTLPAPTMGELFDSIKINYHASSAQSYWLTPYDSVSPYWEYYDPFIDHLYARVNTAPTHQDALAQLWINHPEIRKA